MPIEIGFVGGYFFSSFDLNAYFRHEYREPFTDSMNFY
jgi:hypothetical protein